MLKHDSLIKPYIQTIYANKINRYIYFILCKKQYKKYFSKKFFRI